MAKKIVIGLIVILFLIYLGLMASSLPDSTPSEPVELLEEVAYKEISRNVMGDTLFVVYYFNGYCSYVSEIQFESLQVPHKIADGLYLLPDGAYVK